MQKKIIALAVAGLMSGAAFAQSNVTIYGVMDAMYEHTSASGGMKSNALESGGLSGSRIGFKGEEALGGGMKAVFVMEMNMYADGNTGTAAPDVGANGLVNTRQSYVGIGGNFGTVVAGRLQTPGYDAAAKYDAMAASAFSPVRTFGSNNINGSTIDASSRLNNTVAYISPNFGGVTLVGAYSFAGATGETTTGTGGAAADQESVVALRADYSNGPLDIGFTHHRVNDLGNVTGSEVRENHFGVSYNFGMAKVIGSYQNGKVNGAAGHTDKLWNIGVIVPVGAGNIRVQYAKFDEGAAATSANDASGLGLQYDYAMSKRTTLYGGYQRVSNKGTLAARTIMGGATPTAGGSATGYGVGIRHTF